MAGSSPLVHIKSRQCLYPAGWCIHKHANACILPAGGPYTHCNTCIHPAGAPTSMPMPPMPASVLKFVYSFPDGIQTWNSVSLTVLSLFRSFQTIVHLSTHFLLCLTFFSSTILSAHALCTHLSSLFSVFLYFRSIHSAD